MMRNNADNDADDEVTWPLQVKEEQVRNLLVWVAVATTALIVSVILIIGNSLL